jgi:DNA-binding NarL/FixJ family response regulator
VLIADDHGVVRGGLRQFLSARSGIEVVDEAATGTEVLSKLDAQPVDVLLLDIAMPATPFPGLLRELKAQYPKLRVLILSMQPEDQFAARALREGAAGYVSKDRSTEELVEAIHRVVRGGKYVSPALAEQFAISLESGRPAVAHEALSNREHEVLRLIGAGKTPSEIAAALSLSPKTVSTYRTRILQKLRLTSTSELIRYALEHQLTH